MRKHYMYDEPGLSLRGSFIAEAISNATIKSRLLRSARNDKKQHFLTFYACIYLLILLILTGCNNLAQNRHSDFTPSMPVNPVVTPEEVSAPYVFQPGDVVEVKLFYTPALNDRIKIRPDGFISLQLVDEVRAAGMTPAELDNVLTEKYAKVLREPQVTVIACEFGGQKVYVGGEISSPGLVSISGKLTVLQAILQSGGFKDTAEKKTVVILRNHGLKEPTFMVIDLEQDLETLTNHEDVLLKPYDIVFVPKSTIARMNQFMDQYFDKLIPINKNFGFSYIYNLKPQVEVK